MENNYNYVLNNEFNSFKELVLNIKNYFYNEKETIHKARNELKIITYNNVDLVVKSFKVPNNINKIVYTYLKNSKAKKSYDNAIKLQSLGINTPTPVAFIEFFEKGFIKESYFISLKFDYDFTIREPLLRDNNFFNRDAILEEFSKFTFNLHQKGVLHRDYSPGNILIKKLLDDEYVFSIVDINRMEFRKLTYTDRLKNFYMLWANDTDLAKIISSYSKYSGYEESKAIETALLYSRNHKKFKNLRKKLKGK